MVFQERQSALHIAAENGHNFVVQILINSGAEIDAVENVSQ